MTCIEKRKHIVVLAGASRCILDKQRCPMQPSAEGHYTAAIVSNRRSSIDMGKKKKKEMQQSQVID